MVPPEETEIPLRENDDSDSYRERMEEQAHRENAEPVRMLDDMIIGGETTTAADVAAAADELTSSIKRLEEAALLTSPDLPDPITNERQVMPMREVLPLLPEYTAQELQRFTLADKIRHYWSVIDTFVEQSVVAAETLLGPSRGPEKKTYVTDQVMTLLKLIEERVNAIPDWIQPVVFHAFRFGINMTIERVVKSFKARGTI